MKKWKSKKITKRKKFEKRFWFFVRNPNFLILISLQPNFLRPWIFQTSNLYRSNNLSLKKRSTPSGCKDLGIRTLVARTSKSFYKNFIYLVTSIMHWYTDNISTLAPEPIRAQTCVCCLFWTNKNIMAVTSIFLSISLSIRDNEPFNRRYQ